MRGFLDRDTLPPHNARVLGIEIESGRSDPIHPDVKLASNRRGDTATCLRVAGEMIRDNVLYHPLPVGLQAVRGIGGTCPKWRLFAQVDCRSEMRPIAFVDPEGRFPILIHREAPNCGWIRALPCGRRRQNAPKRIPACKPASGSRSILCDQPGAMARQPARQRFSPCIYRGSDEIFPWNHRRGSEWTPAKLGISTWHPGCSYSLRPWSGGPLHGYAITSLIRRQSDDALLVEEGTLYPALWRLENKGLLEAEWGLSENNRKAKFYRLTAKGQRELRQEVKTWEAYVAAVTKVLGATQPPLPEEMA